MGVKSGSASYGCDSGDTHWGESVSTTPSLTYTASTGTVKITGNSKTNTWTNQSRRVSVSITIRLYLIY